MDPLKNPVEVELSPLYPASSDSNQAEKLPPTTMVATDSSVSQNSNGIISRINWMIGGIAYVHWRASVLDSNALVQKYALEGITIQAYDTESEMVHTDNKNYYDITCKYRRPGIEGYYVSEKFRVSADFYRHQVQNRYLDVIEGLSIGEGLRPSADETSTSCRRQSLELLVLPDYPMSRAILKDYKSWGNSFPSLNEADPDFKPFRGHYVLIPLFCNCFIFLCLCLAWVFDYGKMGMTMTDYGKMGMTMTAVVGVQYIVGYWLARFDRDDHLSNQLYGANHIVGNGDQELSTGKPRVSYDEFFHQEKRSIFIKISILVRDLIAVVGYIPLIAFFWLLSGISMVMSGLVAGPWQKKTLTKIYGERHRQSVSKVVGDVVARPNNGHSVVVLYKVSNVWYKKRLKAPLAPGTTPRHILQTNFVPNKLDLVYVSYLPTSAILESAVPCVDGSIRPHDQEGLSTTCTGRALAVGLFVVAFQVGIVALITYFIPFRSSIQHTELIAAGIAVGAQILVGVFTTLHECFSYQRHILYGAKEVTNPILPRNRHDDVEDLFQRVALAVDQE